MIRVAILGASGYTALESIKILLRHPEVRITALCSRRPERPPIAELFPALTGRLDLRCEPFEPDVVAEKADVVLCALPHTASMAAVPGLLERGMKVVDFSADYRLSDPAVYTQWYEAEHTDADRLGEAVYGLPELYMDRLTSATLVANPGCYPTGPILALSPLLASGLIEPTGIVVDAKSGVSGAGRKPKLAYHYPECNESVRAYAIGTHRHTPEIIQVVSDVGGKPVELAFTPHLVPMDRGILATIYARPVGSTSAEEAMQALRESYDGLPFVTVVERLPGTKDVAHTNRVHMTVRSNGSWLVIVTALDNLIKGASGAAIQNMNIISGLPQETGLL